MEKIRTSLDWADVECQIRANLKGITYTRDFDQLLVNTRRLVKLLSNEEIKHRSGRSSQVFEILSQVHEMQGLMEDYLIMHRLSS